MRKKIIFVLMASLLPSFLQPALGARKAAVWEHPATAVNTEIEGYFHTLLEITRVEFDKEETRVIMRVSLRPEHWVRFSSDTYLLADGKRYALKGCEGMELDKEVHLTDHNQASAVFRFEPLPKKTERFDFIEGDGQGAFRILGVESADTRAEQLFPSNWRNAQTGSWEISFYEDFAIFGCRFWNYKQRRQKGDRHAMVLENEGREISVSVDRSSKGKRRIIIDGKEGEYDVITSICLPDYPRKDTCTAFRDTGYRTDTVTFAGWLKDMPEALKKMGSEYTVNHYCAFTGKPVTAYGKMDSLGRFVMKIPLLNASEVFLDWKRTFIRTVFEPGETYFMLYDWKAGHKIFMGKNARLQNETLAHPIGWLTGNYGRDMDQAAAMNFLEGMKQQKQDLMDELAKLTEAHPTVSPRYTGYLAGNYNAMEGRELMQARYGMKGRTCPGEYLAYTIGQHWRQRARPYTLYREFATFRRDLLGALVQDRYGIRLKNGGTFFSFMTADILRRNRDEGRLEIGDEELAVVDSHDKATENAVRLMLDGETEAYEAARAELEQRESAKLYREIMARADVRRIVRDEAPLAPLYRTLQMADSLGCDKDLRDIIAAGSLFEILDQQRQPLNETAMRLLHENVSMPGAKAFIQAEQEKYLALQRKDISASLGQADLVAGMSDGEKILRKLIEPYKGKLILLDVWGTWCGPCKAALAKSQEEYERLNPYDIVYLYLANNSSEESWKNVIKEYNVTGDNVVHYNLPAEQQSAVEAFLGVSAFPTYKLIDRDGTVLDVNADPRDLDGLVRLLERMK